MGIHTAACVHCQSFRQHQRYVEQRSLQSTRRLFLARKKKVYFLQLCNCTDLAPFRHSLTTAAANADRV